MSDQLRIGDAERDHAAKALGEHYATGRISKEEYDPRDLPALGNAALPRAGRPAAPSGGPFGLCYLCLLLCPVFVCFVCFVVPSSFCLFPLAFRLEEAERANSSWYNGGQSGGRNLAGLS